MPHVIEPAASGRSKCRGCNGPIARAELRFGERQPNAFGDGEMTLWMHLQCAAYKRPEPLLETLDAEDAPSIDCADVLRPAAELGIAHRRLPRLDGAGRAPSGRARCRSCREMIDKGAWRIGLVFFEGYRFEPSGYIHLACTGDYFGTVDVVERIAHFSPALADGDIEEIGGLLG